LAATGLCVTAVAAAVLLRAARLLVLCVLQMCVKGRITIVLATASRRRTSIGCRGWAGWLDSG
jgi:hypothetical protein